MARSNKREARSPCPIAATLDILGDRWSLIVVRDMFRGKKRFAEFLESPEAITTSVLSDRLAGLEVNGLVERRPYQKRPPRYEYVLTEDGRALLPVLQEICRWGNKTLPDTWTAPASFMRKKP
ncbi:helix-turn-helix domain-containing protein [Pelagibius sp. CAU 1746]|uniref:winged helix-turn-helix transcriptional regulator n=1 Tax=Pelagibius sp. CAU 1746 TaxID=3140370 RepID=UPI00325AF2E5